MGLSEWCGFVEGVCKSMVWCGAGVVRLVSKGLDLLGCERLCCDVVLNCGVVCCEFIVGYVRL